MLTFYPGWRTYPRNHSNSIVMIHKGFLQVEAPVAERQKQDLMRVVAISGWSRRSSRSEHIGAPSTRGSAPADYSSPYNRNMLTPPGFAGFSVGPVGGGRQLGMREGDVLVVTDDSNPHWWSAYSPDSPEVQGQIPASCVRVVAFIDPERQRRVLSTPRCCRPQPFEWQHADPNRDVCRLDQEQKAAARRAVEAAPDRDLLERCAARINAMKVTQRGIEALTRGCRGIEGDGDGAGPTSASC